MTAMPVPPTASRELGEISLMITAHTNPPNMAPMNVARTQSICVIGGSSDGRDDINAGVDAGR